MTRALHPSKSLLKQFNFDNRFTRELPADPITTNSRRQVEGACFSRVQPTPVQAPALVAYSKEAAGLLDLQPEDINITEFAQVFSGNALLPGMDPYAMCYGGHQFGNWAGQLGDGRAINLGELVNQHGHHWMLQLKGAGPTPYSRSADGLAVLRSSLREFICSEAMFHLGVPTTRALSLILTGESVMRDMFYDGHPALEPGAVVCRLAPTFIRFGNFEILAARGDHTTLKQLVEFTITHHFPQFAPATNEHILAWFEQVCRLTVQLVVAWLRVGFVHGVMNTDNMSILGLTIDYGPYGWLEDYDPTWTPNTTDSMGKRYCFGRQAHIAHWNLARLAGALHPLIGEAAPLEEILRSYTPLFNQSWQEIMANKLGLLSFVPATDQKLVDDLLNLLPQVETDMTLFFRNLAQMPLVVDRDQDRLTPLMEAFYQPKELTSDMREKFSHWLARYAHRLCEQQEEPTVRKSRMNQVNPLYVARNYLAQLAIDKVEQGDFSLVNELLEVLRHPYEQQPGMERFARKRPEWARHRPGCSMLSCSS